MLQLELLGTVGCHLCDDAEQVLLASLDFDSVEVELVDIAESNELMEKYALRIPVLRHASGVSLDWPFQIQQVQGLVQQLTTSET